MGPKWMLSIGLVALLMGSAAHGQFVPGHVFVVEAQYEGCFERHAHHGLIWEIDPVSGDVSLFLALPEELCGGLGPLVFTPDGTHLRASRGFIENVVLEFDAYRNYTTALDTNQGLSAPLSMTYDSEGNFCVANEGAQNILHFPADGGPATVFADAEDGIWGVSGMAFAADGDLYCAVSVAPGPLPSRLLRITPAGEASVFDEYGFRGRANGVAADARGYIYAVITMPELHGVVRYTAGDPGSREVLNTDIRFFGNPRLTMSPDESALYITDGWFRVYRVNLADGEAQILGEWPGVNGSGGMAVVPFPTGDVDGDRDADLTDLALLTDCLTGPGSGVLPVQCLTADLDHDGDIDFMDVRYFQMAFTGSRP